MSKYIEKVDMLTLPLVPLKGVVVFPNIPTSFDIVSKKAIKAIKVAEQTNGLLFMSALENAVGKGDDVRSVYKTGVVARIKQSVKLPSGEIRVLIEGKYRAEIDEFISENGYTKVKVFSKSVILTDNGGIKAQALIHETITIFDEYIKLLPKISNEVIVAAHSITDPGLLADFIAANVLFKFTDKQKILEELNPYSRLELLCVILENEAQILDVELNLHHQVKSRIDRNQKEYYLREQLKAIQNELGNSPDMQISDGEEYIEKIEKACLPKEVEEKLIKEATKLDKMPFGTSESTVIRNYLDVCLEIPWEKRTADRFDVKAASKILEKDHDGLEKVKDRILEFIAVKALAPELKGQILCLVGPPGVGKSSIACSIARAIKRKFVRVSLGGIRDEAEIRGHRKTYIGSMPGRIVNALTKAQSMNPVILLDEIDKLSKDSHGDPSSALLEVLDSDQNKSFRDHFIELPVDLSECIFIATANTLDTVPRPLIDRMEIINLTSYTRNEKISIFNNHLLPKQLKRHGLTKRYIKISNDAICELIDYYTKEAGVRNLERETAALCRKIARITVENGTKSHSITANNLKDYIGNRKYHDDCLQNENLIGVVNGLAWTELGGEMLQVETAFMNGSGKLELTGKLGDVMKESANAAITYIRCNSTKFGIDPGFYKKYDLHIHFPDGATPKDGPSAGVTMAVALVSLLGNIEVRNDVAMTGEITLKGRVLPIGGLKEKTMAAYRHGIKTIIVPYENRYDIEEIDPMVKDNTEIVFAKTIDDVLDVALLKNEIDNTTEQELYIPIDNNCREPLENRI